MQRRPHSTPANFCMAAGEAEIHSQAMATHVPNVHQQTHFHTQASIQNRQLTPCGTQMQSASTSTSENYQNTLESYQNTSLISQNSSSWNNFSLQNTQTASSYSSHGSTPLTAYSEENTAKSTTHSVQNSTTSTAYSLPYSPTSTSYSLQHLTPSTTFSVHNCPTSTACSLQNSSSSTSLSLQNSTPHAANSLHNSPTAAHNRNSSAPTIVVGLQNSTQPMAMSLQDSSSQTVLSLQDSTSTTVTALQNSSTSSPISVYQSTSTILTSSITQSTSSTSPILAKTSVSSSSIKDLLKSSSPKSKQGPQLLVEETKEEDSSDLGKTLSASEYDLIEEYISQDLQKWMPNSKIDGQDRNHNNARDKLSEEFSGPNLKTIVDLEYSSSRQSIKSITDDEISRIYDDCPFLPEIKNVSIELVETSKYIDALVLLKTEHDRLRSSLTRLGDLTFVDAVLMMKEIIEQHHQLFPIISRRHEPFPDRPDPSPMTKHVASLKPDNDAGNAASSSELEIMSIGSQDQGLAQTKTSLNPQASDQDASAPHHQEDYFNKCQMVSSIDSANSEPHISRISDNSKYSPSKKTTELQNNKTPTVEEKYNTESSSELNFNTKTSEALNYNNQTSTELHYNIEKSTELNLNNEISSELPYSDDPSRELQCNNRPPGKLNYTGGSPQEVTYNTGPLVEVNYRNNLSNEPHYSGYQQSIQSQQRQSYSHVKTPTLGSNPPRLRLKNSLSGSMKTENCQSSSCAQKAQDLRFQLPSVDNRQNTHQGGPSYNPKRFCTMNDAPIFPSHQMSTFRYMNIPPHNSYALSSETHYQNSRSLSYNAQMSPNNTSLSTPLTSVTQDTFYGDSPRQFSQHSSQDYEFTNTSENLPSQYYEEDKPRYQFHNQ